MLGFVAEFNKFIAAVDWSQRWLWGLGAYMGLLLVCIVIFRHNITVQVSLFGLCLAQILCAQPINSWARHHWKSFASANYFGEKGFFISIVLSVPSILLALVALVNLLIATASLAATVKRMQFQHEKRAKRD